MHVAFESSHVAGDFRSRTLTVAITCDDLEAGISVHDDIHFSAPPDFHVHNDLVAAALLPLVETRECSVRFNFGVSASCADMLRNYYQLREIGPVDPALSPRTPGRHLGLSFSGGLDSTALWVILRELLDEPVKVIHSAFSGGFEREQTATAGYALDVDCATDLREQGFDQSGRFLASVPLLYADYADLGSVTFGNNYFHSPPLHVESLADGRPPAFLTHDQVLNAGGLAELHLVRGLMSWSYLRPLILTAPERVEAALAASAAPGSMKHAIKALSLRDTYERLGLPLPAFLDPWIPPRRPTVYGARLDADGWALYFLKTRGPELVRPWMNGIERVDRAVLDQMSFDFVERYNPNLIDLIPTALRNRYLSVLHRFGIYPYAERDWRDLAMFKRLMHVERHARATRR